MQIDLRSARYLLLFLLVFVAQQQGLRVAGRLTVMALQAKTLGLAGWLHRNREAVPDHLVVGYPVWVL